MLKETEAQETRGFFVTFLSLVAFQLVSNGYSYGTNRKRASTKTTTKALEYKREFMSLPKKFFVDFCREIRLIKRFSSLYIAEVYLKL